MSHMRLILSREASRASTQIIATWGYTETGFPDTGRKGKYRRFLSIFLILLTLADLSTGEELLVWGVDESGLVDLLRAMDAAASSAGTVGVTMVDSNDKGRATVSEPIRTRIDGCSSKDTIFRRECDHS